MSGTDKTHSEPGCSETKSGRFSETSNAGAESDVDQSGGESVWISDQRGCTGEPKSLARPARRMKYEGPFARPKGVRMLPPGCLSPEEEALLKAEHARLSDDPARTQTLAVYATEDGDEIELALQVRVSRGQLSEAAWAIVAQRLPVRPGR